MVLLYVIRSHCYLYLLYVMVVEHHLVLSMSLIVALGAWSLVGTVRFGMLLVTLLLSLVWAPVVKEPVVHDGSAEKVPPVRHLDTSASQENYCKNTEERKSILLKHAL